MVNSKAEPELRPDLWFTEGLRCETFDAKASTRGRGSDVNGFRSGHMGTERDQERLEVPNASGDWLHWLMTTTSSTMSCSCARVRNTYSGVQVLCKKEDVLCT